ncbi:MAG: hypothetical protein GY749_48605 [Desulfobacteraceae bacterium]|nr:hypothetical protein [Desulfobacteraceae bacterium]
MSAEFWHLNFNGKGGYYEQSVCKNSWRLFLISVINLITASAYAGGIFDCSSASIVDFSIQPSMETETASRYRVRLTCDDIPKKWEGERFFMLSRDNSDAMYATIMTAASLKKEVFVKVGGTGPNYLILLVYLSQ